jgi:hypothetical protein
MKNFIELEQITFNRESDTLVPEIETMRCSIDADMIWLVSQTNMGTFVAWGLGESGKEIGYFVKESREEVMNRIKEFTK